VLRTALCCHGAYRLIGRNQTGLWSSANAQTFNSVVQAYTLVGWGYSHVLLPVWVSMCRHALLPSVVSS
jgi:hypothetical protein